MGVRRGSQKQFCINVDMDLTECESVIITFATARKIIFEKTKEDILIEPTELWFSLTQEETLSLPEGSINYQVAYTMADGTKDASDIGTVKVDKLLRGESW